MGDEVGGVDEVDLPHTRTTVTAQREHVLDALMHELADIGVHVRAGRTEAGEVRERRGTEVPLDGRRDLGGVEPVARSTRRVGDGDPVRRGPGHLAGDLIGVLEGHLALGWKDLERVGLPCGELIGDSHGWSPPYRFVEHILAAGGAGREHQLQLVTGRARIVGEDEPIRA